MKGAWRMNLLTRIKRTLNAQLVTLSVLGVTITLLLAMGSSMWLNLKNSHQLLDQNMKNIVSFLTHIDEVKNIFASSTEKADIQLLLNTVAKQTDEIDVIAVLDADGNLLAYGSTSGKPVSLCPPQIDGSEPQIDGSEGDIFLQNGSPESKMERCAYAKVYGANGTLLGFIGVGVYIRSFYDMISWTVIQYILIALVAISIGGMLAHYLAAYIKKELHGYEPDVFSQLVAQRSEVWNALEEGILAIDKSANIIYLNEAAKKMLSFPCKDVIGQPLHKIYPKSKLDSVLTSSKAEYNVPLKSLSHIKVIADRMPIVKDGKTIGAVAIFRNRTELTLLAEDLTGIKYVADALRAHTHEFMNQMHVILGLLQLEEYKKAEEYVLELTKTRVQSIGGITERIHEPVVAALLIGKLSRAQEMHVTLKLNKSSSYPRGSRCLPADSIISILGNLIENAFDSFKNMSDNALREIEVCLEEDEKGLLISVEDTGCGISKNVQKRMFERGFSTKGDGRGNGLALVYNIVQAYSGSVRIESAPGLGTAFIINIPIQDEQSVQDIRQ